MKILITNDDSHRSPLLELAIDYFSRFGEVVLVVPEHEQSWMGKRITRFTPVHVREIELFGRKAFSVDGSPADCASIGIYTLCGEKPDLVVSGINAGFNLGIGFVFSSGTIGACLEANIAGVPAIALSQAFDSSTHSRYVSDYMIEEQTIARFRAQGTGVLDRITEILFSAELRGEVLQTPITWNVNLPSLLDETKPVTFAPLGVARYAQCFVEQESVGGSSSGMRVFAHQLQQAVLDDNPCCDSSLLRAGTATLTPIDLWQFAEVTKHAGLVRRVEEVLGRG
jgi:5'/3'-nucleotidase SurE